MFVIFFFAGRAFPTVLSLGAIDGNNLRAHVIDVTPDTANAAASATCDFLLRLLATSKLPSVIISARQNVPTFFFWFWYFSLFPTEPKLSSKSFAEKHDLERRRVSCTRDHVTT
jgi:hypothetical protein